MNIEILKWVAERAEASPEDIRLEITSISLIIRGTIKSYVTGREGYVDRVLPWVQLDAVGRDIDLKRLLTWEIEKVEQMLADLLAEESGE